MLDAVLLSLLAEYHALDHARTIFDKPGLPTSHPEDVLGIGLRQQGEYDGRIKQDIQFISNIS